MPNSRRNQIVVAATTLVLVLLLWSCGTSGTDDEGSSPATSVGDPAATTSPTLPEPPPITPVTGGTDDEGQPEPPPIHAVFSVVVRGDTSWHPYAGPELNGLDSEAAQAIAARLRQLVGMLGEAGIPVNIELAYGPAAALCEVDPAVLDEVEGNGHRIAMHVRSAGEAFRAQRALGGCGRAATTASGLAGMADPPGTTPPTVDTLNDALAILSVLDLHQVTGKVATVCTDLGLAEPTHGYGTGAFTAPWRSGWTEGQPCTDLPRGRIVIIDQNLLVPGEGASRIGPDSISTLRARTEQMLAYALDLRFAEPADLPFPGIITWGVSVRLDDLIAPEPEGEDDGDADSNGDDAPANGNGEDAEGEGANGESEDTESTPTTQVDPRTAPLSEETLAELALAISEKWASSMESGRLIWMLPDELGLMLRPLDLTGGD